MNGRIYDPIIGRMIGPDPIIGDFTSIQDFNGYSYVLNNPLRYTDPKGYEYDPVTVYGEYDDWWNSHEFMHPGPGDIPRGGKGAGGPGGGNNPDVTVIGHLNPIFGLPWLYAGYLFWTRMLAVQSLVQENELETVTVHAFRPKKKGVIANQRAVSPNMMMASSDKRNPIQDKKLTPHDIKNLQRQGWVHRDKGDHGGQTDLWKDREGNVYQKPKNGAGPGEPIGYNLNDFSSVPQSGFSWQNIGFNPTVLKVGAIIGIGALIIITDGVAAPLIAL